MIHLAAAASIRGSRLITPKTKAEAIVEGRERCPMGIGPSWTPQLYDLPRRRRLIIRVVHFSLCGPRVLPRPLFSLLPFEESALLFRPGFWLLLIAIVSDDSGAESPRSMDACGLRFSLRRRRPKFQEPRPGCIPLRLTTYGPDVVFLNHVPWKELSLYLTWLCHSPFAAQKRHRCLNGRVNAGDFIGFVKYL